LGQNPGHNLLAEEHDLSARPGAKVRQAFGQEPLSYTPDRAAKKSSNFSDSERLA